MPEGLPASSFSPVSEASGLFRHQAGSHAEKMAQLKIEFVQLSLQTDQAGHWCWLNWHHGCSEGTKASSASSAEAKKERRKRRRRRRKRHSRSSSSHSRRRRRCPCSGFSQPLSLAENGFMQAWP
eukprot:s2087_g3.t1